MHSHSHSHSNPALYIPIPCTPPFQSSTNCNAVSMAGGDEEDIIEPHTIGSGERNRSRIFERSKSYWVLVVSSILALIVGQAAATLLSRYYFDNGGNSRWLSTLLQCVGWPILLIPLLFYFQKKQGSSRLTPLTPKLGLIYVALGLLVAGDNLLYSWGVSFMPASTYSLLCSSQLAFNGVFAFILNKQKITPSVLNSLVILIFSAVLLGVHSSSDRPEGVSNAEYIVGFVCTVAASAMYGLILPLMQLVFQRVIKKETFAVVIEMQIYTSIVATAVCIMGLFISRESEDMKKEASNFITGKLAYYMTLIWSAIGWQLFDCKMNSSSSCERLLFANATIIERSSVDNLIWHALVALLL
ncbi:hypothetical protein SUGI_0181540 [Cryptomeria japonica]|nr:hypothetical protein SUGI_0181540 [Cryptomeria japonica]